MEITVLVENTTNTELSCEHGLSFWISYNGKNYLLDAGSTELFMENAKQLKIPVLEADRCILSHGHYDHSGGFTSYLEKNKSVSIYAGSGFDGAYFSLSGGMHYIGVSKELAEKYRERFIVIDRPKELDDSVWLIPHETAGLEKIAEEAGLYKQEKGNFKLDDFSHELSLVFDTKKGLIIFNSCSHAGFGTIIKEIQHYFPDKKIYAFLGGLHMKGKKDGKEICRFSEDRINQLLEEINASGMDVLYTGHCTGLEGYRLLKEKAGNRIQILVTGKNIQL